MFVNKTLQFGTAATRALAGGRYHSTLGSHSNASKCSSQNPSSSAHGHHHNHLLSNNSSKINFRSAQTQANTEQNDEPSSDSQDPSKLNRSDRRSAERDRRVPVSWETSVRYLESETYRKTYGKHKIWQLYRRPLHAQLHQLPYTNRISCVKDGFIAFATPCPVCRDRNLVLHENNVKLLEQFINPWTEEVYEMRKVHVCQVKYEELLVAMYKARDLGHIRFTVPFRQFDYDEFYSQEWIQDRHLEDIRLADENPIFRKLQDIQDPTDKPYTYTDFP